MRKLLAIIAIHITLLSVLRYTVWPENVLWPYLSHSGLTLYRDIFHIYPPLYVLLLTFSYAISPFGIGWLVVLTYLSVALTDLGLWLAAKKKILPLILFIPLHIFFDGNSLWPDHVVALFFIFGYYFFNCKRYFLMGLLLGLALLTKQTAAYFSVGLLVFVFFQDRKPSDLGRVLAGLIVPFVCLVPWFIMHHNFPAFIQQVFVYILSYHAKNSLQIQFPTASQLAVMTLVFGIPLAYSLMRKNFHIGFLIVLASLGIFTRFEYFHLQPALPLLAVLISQNIRRVGLFYLVFLLLAVKMGIRDFHQPPRFLTPDLIQNGKMIATYSPPGTRTLFIATWDHYYYLSHTLPIGNFFVSSTPWNISYPGVQEKYISKIETFHPQYLFLGECMWEKGVCYPPEKIHEYVKMHYTKVSELPDGTGVFKYNPVSPGEKL